MTQPQPVSRWRELWQKEDWWAVWLGLGLVVVAAWLFAHGGSIKPLAVKPPRWETLDALFAHFRTQAGAYALQFLGWAAIFGASARIMGHRLREFLPAFAFVYVVAVAIFAIGAWSQASRYNLEPPLVALVLGMLVSNLVRLPAWMDTGFRVEYYIKTGIVLLGATLPFTLIVWAGPIALLQATIVSIATFGAIYAAGRWLGLDRRLCACLGAGGAVCGVSASIAVAGAVRATKEQLSYAITLVIAWAIAMIFFLPFAARLLELHAGIAGAWIGNSEFADAAGLAAAQAYGQMAEASDAIAGSEDQAVWNFTLVKVIGRDMWIGIWAFVLALVSTLRWEADAGGAKPSALEIWWRFPKFVIGFFAASLLMTAITGGESFEAYKATAEPKLVAPLKDLRTWAFIFCFFSIGLTTRFRELAGVGGRPLAAFTLGALVNVPLGYVLSAHVFGAHWAGVGAP